MIDIVRNFLESKYVRKLKRHWLTVAFVFGFITDFLLLNRIDDIFDNLILLFYAILATVSFLLLYVATAEKLSSFFNKLLKQYTPVLMQYAFGGLLSGMLIFYGRSGDWIASAPFLLLIVTVILGNEFVKKQSNRLIYHLVLYFIGIYSYIVLVVPVILGRMGDMIFIFSGLIALAIVCGVVKLLYKIVPNFMRANTRSVILTIGFIYIGFNTLYFTSLIPPIPLSLTQLDIVHSVSRTDSGSYRIVREESSLVEMLSPFKTSIHPSRSTIACFARVYAPTRLSTDIYHRWEYKDDNGDWIERFRLSYPVSNANKGGYRGYTTAGNLKSGIWRCSVETERGQVLGREVVRIDLTESGRELVTTIQ